MTGDGPGTDSYSIARVATTIKTIQAIQRLGDFTDMLRTWMELPFLYKPNPAFTPLGFLPLATNPQHALYSHE